MRNWKDSESLKRPKPEDWARVYGDLEIDGSGLEAMSVLSQWVLDQSDVGEPLPMSIIAACDAVYSMPGMLRGKGVAVFAKENRSFLASFAPPDARPAGRQKAPVDALGSMGTVVSPA